MTTIHVPDIPGPRRPLCWKQASNMWRCDRATGHAGPCIWELAVTGQPLTCEWTEDADSGSWWAACESRRTFEFNHHGPTANGFRFCPYCGEPLVERPYVEREADDEPADRASLLPQHDTLAEHRGER